MQAYVDNSQEATRPKTSTSAGRSSESSLARWAHSEVSRATLRSYPSRLELAFAPHVATIRFASSDVARAERTAGFDVGRTLLSVSKKGLGPLSDGRKAVPSQPRYFSRSGVAPGQREYARLVSRIHNHSRLYTQTDPSFGFRRGFRHYPTRQGPGSIVQLCHFHLISRLQNCRGRRNRRLEGRRLREALYQNVRRALDLPDGHQLRNVLKTLRRLVRRATGLRVMRMIVREFLRRVDHFRAYRKHPELHLPTTTGSVEAMNRRVRDLMRQTRSISSPQALLLWAIALIRKRPNITCNGKNFQQNSLV